MKFLLISICLLFTQQIFAQKTEFSINQEKARFQENTQNIAITTTRFKIEKGVIDTDLKTLIIQLMTEKQGYVSVDFIGDTEILVEHQETITTEMILKTINRRGKKFKQKVPLHIGVDK